MTSFARRDSTLRNLGLNSLSWVLSSVVSWNGKSPACLECFRFQTRFLRSFLACLGLDRQFARPRRRRLRRRLRCSILQQLSSIVLFTATLPFVSDV